MSHIADSHACYVLSLNFFAHVLIVERGNFCFVYLTKLILMHAMLYTLTFCTYFEVHGRSPKQKDSHSK